MFSIIIPTLNNLDYLKLCIKSIKNTTSLNNEILVHVVLIVIMLLEIFLKGQELNILLLRKMWAFVQLLI